MQRYNKSGMIIIGGTYTEICFEPRWDNMFGSGFRAVTLISEYDANQQISFHTCCDKKTKDLLDYYMNLNPKLELCATEISKSPTFYYDYPLKTPSIFPRPDSYSEDRTKLNVSGKNILAYGLIEASIQLEGEKVVYDPQSPVNPKSFSSTGSKADKLIMIINLSEAQRITNTSDIKEIRDFFFKKEKCFALIVKMGAKGAFLFETENSDSINIPVYKTEQIWPIGSGDVFTAFFAYNWFKGESLINSAISASKATAIYCNSKDLAIQFNLKSFSFPELTFDSVPEGQIYLAGPFFTFAQRWLVNEIWRTLKSFGLKVFSPYHDIGHGNAQDVVQKDLVGLDKSEIVFAIIDGLDSGTLFEVGYAIAQNKKIIAFVQNESEESLKMLEGTNCLIESDLTTAIYKTYWNLGQK